uniref:Uncharacterized protein n=1 Tax=Octopus bimaculoides TaxID=37653 RepID=A0A0L8GAW2_OCTBM
MFNKRKYTACCNCDICKCGTSIYSYAGIKHSPFNHLSQIRLDLQMGEKGGLNIHNKWSRNSMDPLNIRPITGNRNKIKLHSCLSYKQKYSLK